MFVTVGMQVNSGTALGIKQPGITTVQMKVTIPNTVASYFI